LRWQLLWLSDILLKEKTFIWQIHANGLFSNKGAKKFGNDTGKCKVCTRSIEDSGQSFYECTFALQVWDETAKYYQTLQQNNIFGNSTTLLDSIEEKFQNLKIDLIDKKWEGLQLQETRAAAVTRALAVWTFPAMPVPWHYARCIPKQRF
jgi:hypothetical protein